MPVFRRPAEASPAEDAVEAPPKPGGKGRPTPKRREAQRARRQAVKAPSNRKEAYKQRREQIKQDRRTQRRALISGDERNLPPRDAGPVKRYVRDIVDARRTVASWFMPAAVLLLVVSAVPSRAITALVSFGYAALLLGIVADSWLLGRSVQRRVTEKFGAKEAHGVRMYAVTRSLQIRRFRMPPPKVKKGEAVS